MNDACLAAQTASLTGAPWGPGISTLCFGIALVCFVLSAGFLYCIARRSVQVKKVRTRKLVALALSSAVLGALGLIGWYRITPPAAGASEKAAERIIHVLQTDENARLDRLERAGVERGPRDSKPEYNARGEEVVPEAEIQSACRLVTALTQADLPSLRSLIASYKFRPHARAQIAESLNWTFYKCGLRYSISFHERWFYIQPSGLVDGGYSIVLSALDEEEPAVHLCQRDKRFPRQFSSDVATDVSAEEVLKMFQMDIVHSILAEQKKEIMKQRRWGD